MNAVPEFRLQVFEALTWFFLLFAGLICGLLRHVEFFDISEEHPTETSFINNMLGNMCNEKQQDAHFFY